MKKMVCSLLACLSILSCAPVSYAEEIATIGVPQFDQAINMLDSDHPVAQIVRSAVFLRLVTISTDSAQKNSLQLEAADMMNVSDTFSVWSFRLKSGLQFHNGREITAQDVLYSLTRCQQRGQFPTVEQIVLRKPPAGDLREQWIELHANVSADQRIQFPLQLSRCPIVERDSAVLFAADFGYGSNFVGAGDYTVKGFRSGRDVSLARIRSTVMNQEGGSLLELRAIEDAKQALTALRLGTIDAFMSTSDEIARLAAGDITLESLKCNEFTLVRRRSFTFNCSPEISLHALRYRFDK